MGVGAIETKHATTTTCGGTSKPFGNPTHPRSVPAVANPNPPWPNVKVPLQLCLLRVTLLVAAFVTAVQFGVWVLTVVGLVFLCFTVLLFDRQRARRRMVQQRQR